MRSPFWLVAAALMMVITTNAVATENPALPGREKYKHIQTVELNELYAQIDVAQIVDVRSQYEFSTLHIKGARNVPLHADNFIAEIRKLRQASQAPIVFYCNGKDCLKSYMAAEKARANNIDNIFAYDRGVMEWAKKYPEHTLLLGKPLINADKLISKDKFEQHLLSAREFDEMVFDNQSIVVDVRETINSRATPLYPLKQRYLPLDNEKLANVVREAKQQGKTLLVYDNVGGQVRWLQYFLEQEQVPSYYFLKGGADTYMDIEVALMLDEIKSRTSR